MKKYIFALLSAATFMTSGCELYPGTSGIDKATGRNVWKDR